MAWTYDATNLSTDTAAGRLNTVRLLLGDTDTNDQQMQDEEITFSLSEANDNVYFAAAWCARVVASKYARQVNTELDGALSADYSDLSRQYASLADNLEYQGKKSSAAVGVLAGGINKVTMDGVRANTNRVLPSFRRDRFKIDGDDTTDYA